MVSPIQHDVHRGRPGVFPQRGKARGAVSKPTQAPRPVSQRRDHSRVTLSHLARWWQLQHKISHVYKKYDETSSVGMMATDQTNIQAVYFMRRRRSAASSYPVDDFGFEGADDAAVVEDWMLFVQLFKRCSRLTGEERCLLQEPGTVWNHCANALRWTPLRRKISMTSCLC